MGYPHYSPLTHMAADYSFFHNSKTTKGEIVAHQTFGGSLLAKSFNMLWAQAIAVSDKGEADYFVMHHSDLAAEPGYVDRLLDLIQSKAADVVSVVVPLKAATGVTSTAIGVDDRFRAGRRLTLHELHANGFPRTFSNADLGHPDKPLLINTGLFIADLSRPWVRKENANGSLASAFSIDDEIRKIDGIYTVGVEPEDWRFSRYLYREGAKVYATTEIRVTHFGEGRYPNTTAWGSHRSDEDCRADWEGIEIANC